MPDNNQDNIIADESLITELLSEVQTNQQSLIVDLFLASKKAMLTMMPKDENGNYFSNKKEDGSGVDSVEVAEKFAKEMTTGIIAFVKQYLQICQQE